MTRVTGIARILWICLGSWLLVASWALPSAATAPLGKAIPTPPEYYVLDEPHLLGDRTLHALEALLIEHDRATGEQFVVAVFQSLDGEDLNDYSNRVFQAWKIGSRGKDNGVLLAVFYSEHKARIEVGYGLEPELTDAKSSRILHDILVPQMQAGDAEQALTFSAYQVLAVLGSPLIQNGRAKAILQAGGSGRPHQARPLQGSTSNGWIVWLVLGFFLLTLVSHLLSSAEAHFTGAGWYRPKPWTRGRFGGPGPGGLGGGFGGLGGFGGGGFGGGGGGGFSGGGGSSGGEAQVRGGDQHTGGHHSPRFSRIVRAIGEAEVRTTGEIRVHLSRRWFEPKPLARARRLFHRHAMQHTAGRNAVLLYVNLRCRRFAIYGDEGIHLGVGQNYWERIARELSRDLRSTHYENAVALAVARIGDTLEELFPVDVAHPHKDELSNEVTSD